MWNRLWTGIGSRWIYLVAEHDEDAQPIFVHCDQSFVDKVQESMNRLLPILERFPIIAKSINNRCIFIEALNRADAIARC